MKVSDSVHQVKELQKNHGEWNDSMKAVSNASGLLHVNRL